MCLDNILALKCIKQKWFGKIFQASPFYDILSYLDHNSRNSRIGVQWLNGYDLSVKESDAITK
jgi:hypothetical protein